MFVLGGQHARWACAHKYKYTEGSRVRVDAGVGSGFEVQGCKEFKRMCGVGWCRMGFTVE